MSMVAPRRVTRVTKNTGPPLACRGKSRRPRWRVATCVASEHSRCCAARRAPARPCRASSSRRAACSASATAGARCCSSAAPRDSGGCVERSGRQAAPAGRPRGLVRHRDGARDRRARGGRGRAACCASRSCARGCSADTRVESLRVARNRRTARRALFIAELDALDDVDAAPRAAAATRPTRAARRRARRAARALRATSATAATAARARGSARAAARAARRRADACARRAAGVAPARAQADRPAVARGRRRRRGGGSVDTMRWVPTALLHAPGRAEDGDEPRAPVGDEAGRAAARDRGRGARAPPAWRRAHADGLPRRHRRPRVLRAAPRRPRDRGPRRAAVGLERRQAADGPQRRARRRGPRRRR